MQCTGRLPALSNPSLHNALKSGARQPLVLYEQDVARMEGVVAKLREALNYSYWCLGALHRLASHNRPLHLLNLEEQLFKAVHMALNDTCRDSTFFI